MPFWWNRRKRFWRPRYRRRNYFRKYKTRNRRYYRRRKHRRPTRRRRRRRGKVRKKLKKLTLKVWQPDTIKKCKIKGFTVNTMGGQGRQFICYTDNRFRWTPRLAPGGGGFGVEKYTLQYLYDEHVRGNNYWTVSNKYLDLVRYTGAKFKFYRHSHVDFVVAYTRMYPMLLEKYTYAYTHPYILLKMRHRKIIPSMLTRPKGKPYVTMKIKPPKQLSTKWFFQETFKDTGLLQLHSAACDLRYSHIGCCNANQLITFKHLNRGFYHNAGWGNATTATQGYKPYIGAQKITKVEINNKQYDVTIVDSSWQASIARQTGWFQTLVLQADKIIQPEEQEIPISTSRYNPTVDTGEGNKVWWVSVVNSSFLPPATDKELIAAELPLWQIMYGYSDYIRKIKKDSTYLKTYYLVFQSKFIWPAATKDYFYIPVDETFVQGRAAYGTDIDMYQDQHWYPSYDHQQEVINSFVLAGPYIPKLDSMKLSTWELKSNYQFFFKWGGAELPEPEITNPKDQATYDIPSDLQQAVQVADPSKQSARKNLHLWDFRRGLITKGALKRICQDTETDSTVSTDGEQTPKKKKKTQGNSLPCFHKETEEVHQTLLSLCEESTCQETQTQQDINQLIKQQQQQQKQLKLHLLKLITNLQHKQTVLQLQTGLLD
nr:MAG: ORF1 [Torque teno midi virus]